jgi:hypothetical protein
MKGNTDAPSEAGKFDAVMRKILSVSHDELKKREKVWKRKRARANRLHGRRLQPPPNQRIAGAAARSQAGVEIRTMS